MSRRRTPPPAVGKNQRGGNRPAVLPQATFTADQVIAAATALASNRGFTRALPRNPGDSIVPFGPGQPLAPVPINAPRTDSGRPEPRQYDYPQSWNLPGFSDRLVPWAILRAAADQIPLFRRCIQIRKDEVATLDWDVTVSKRAVERVMQDDGSSRRDAEQQMRKRLAPEIGRLVAWWEEPDRRNGLDFIGWATKALEEHFVLDALPIYPRYTRGGEPYSLEVIDGSTIKPLLDEYGNRPLAPSPAYQQLLQGFPRGEFVASGEARDDGSYWADGTFPSDRLAYFVHNVRTHTPYGYSSVEQALEDGDVWLRRRAWIKAEYTDGVMPSGWLKAGEGQAEWDPPQLRAYEKAINDLYSGSTAARQRYRILPWGMEPVESPDQSERYKPEYDLFLLKLVASHFETTMAELGFTEQGGLGSTGWHEGQADVQDRKATKPTLRRLQAWCTRLQRQFLGAPAELEFRIVGLDSEDESAQDAVGAARVESARATLNEDRDRTGQPRYEFEEANKPFIVTASGIQFIEGQLAKQQAADEAAALAPVDGLLTDQLDQPTGDGEVGLGAGPAAIGGSQPAPPTPTAAADVAKTDELAAYKRWARKNPTARRPFEFVHNRIADLVTKVDVEDELHAGRVTFKADASAEGGGVDPKAPAPTQAWPGWEVDLELAALYADLLTQGLIGLISPASLVEAWLTVRSGAVAPEPDAGASSVSREEAQHWLHDQGLATRVETAIRTVLTHVYTEGYLVGDRSATSILTGAPVEWGGWTPGHPTAARKLLSSDGRQGLDLLLGQWEIPIKSIASHRLDELAIVLADGLDAKQSPDEMAKAVDALFHDPKWARMVTLTELNRAQTAAAHDRYEQAHVATTDWMTALDDDVCPICKGNEEAGPVPLGDRFPSGVFGPPAHPWCRCATLPGVDIQGLADIDFKKPVPA